jgi:MFS family permease
VRVPWHVYAAFSVIGLGWACLSTTAITTTLAPWFERYQGRALSTALLGASIGGLISARLLFLAIAQFGLATAMLIAALATLIILLPLALLVLKHHPQSIGLEPDGKAASSNHFQPELGRWTRRAALHTAAFLKRRHHIRSRAACADRIHHPSRIPSSSRRRNIGGFGGGFSGGD